MGRPLEAPKQISNEGLATQARYFYATQKINEKPSAHLPTVGDQNRLSSQSNIESSDECN
jgi:hypothetical protein